MRGNLETLEEDDITVTFLRQALIMMRGFVREANVYDMVVDTVKSEQGADQMDVCEAKRLKQLEDENAKLKKLDASNNRLLARLMDSDGGPRRFREAL